MKKVITLVAATAIVGTLCSCGNDQLTGTALGAGVVVMAGVVLGNLVGGATPKSAVPSPQNVQVGQASNGTPDSGKLSPAPTPSDGQVHYGGSGGHGLFGPFYLERGIHGVKYSFQAKNPDISGTSYFFQASLVGSAESNFASKIVVSKTESLTDFNNIQVPYSGNYWIQLDDSQGDWQIDIDPATTPAQANPTPGASTASNPVGTPAPTPMPTPTPSPTQLHYEGHGPRDCGPFYCNKGFLKVVASFTPDAGFQIFRVYLMKPDNSQFNFSSDFDSYSGFSNNQKLFNIIQAGNYYLKMTNAGGSWSIDVTTP